MSSSLDMALEASGKPKIMIKGEVADFNDSGKMAGS
jgi:hypothetical protein